MIGKPEWFTYRIFGWGVMPRTWQGFLYVGIFLAVFGLVYLLPMPMVVKYWAWGIIIAVIFIDGMHIMMQMSKHHDERQNMHQLVIERNVSFGALGAILAVAGYQALQNRHLWNTDQIPFDISLMVILLAMVAVKIVSTVYVKWRM